MRREGLRRLCDTELHRWALHLDELARGIADERHRPPAEVLNGLEPVVGVVEEVDAPAHGVDDVLNPILEDVEERHLVAVPVRDGREMPIGGVAPDHPVRRPELHLLGDGIARQAPRKARKGLPDPVRFVPGEHV